MNNYTVITDQQQGTILVRDGKQCICPFQQPIPTQTAMGAMQLMRLPCSTLCAHAEHWKYNTPDASVNDYIITCAGSEQRFEIVEIPETKILQ
jgi:hypothetical protein